MVTINDLPKEQWLDLTYICQVISGKDHDPDLWKRLCQMDDGKHTHNGYLFEGSSGRVRFRWTKKEARS